jgi:hypothetical protein
MMDVCTGPRDDQIEQTRVGGRVRDTQYSNIHLAFPKIERNLYFVDIVARPPRHGLPGPDPSP